MLKTNLLLFIFGILTVSCSHDKSEDNSPMPPSNNIKDSFAVKTSEVSNSNQNESIRYNSDRIVIKKSSINKTFLLSPTIIPSSNMPILNHLEPKVVIFTKVGNQLALIEQNFQSLYENLPSNKLIQTFTIENETSENIEFQWKYGLESLTTNSSIGVFSDAPATATKKYTNQNENVIPQIKNFIQKMELKNNSLTINELIRLRESSSSVESTMSVYYEFKPYKINEKFQIRSSKLQEGIGYFEVFRTSLYDQMPQFLASRWDISQGKRIVYAITKGAPENIVRAAKEGILYWNRVFGKDVIQVEENVDSNEIPENARVIVHWIPWKNAGFARASLQTDPITGEILKANVYLTSAFAESARRTIITDNFFNKTNQNNISIIPNHFKLSENCSYSSSENNFDMIGIEEPNQIAKKAIEDQIRLVTAHEVGHTLGLRHNFAATYDAEISQNESIDELIKHYKSDLSYQGDKVSNSVMDYIFNVEGLIVGAAIKNTTLLYDEKVINWGYSEDEKSIGSLNIPLFCTDVERMMKNPYGCSVGDVGNNPIHHNLYMQQNVQKNIIKSIILDHILNRISTEDVRNSISFEKALLELQQTDLSVLANYYLRHSLDVFQSLKTNVPVLFANSEFRFGPNWSNSEELKIKSSEKIKQDLMSSGGFLKALQSAHPLTEKSIPVDGWLLQQVEDVFSNDSIASGTNGYGLNYTLTKNQLLALKSKLQILAKKLETKILEGMLASLNNFSSDETFKENIGLEEASEQISNFIKSIIFTSIGNQNAEYEKSAATVDQYKYEKDIQILAIKMLSSKNYRIYGWQSVTSKYIKQTIKDKIKEATKETITTSYEISTLLKNKSMDKNMYTWLKRQYDLLSAIETIDSEVY